MITMRYANKKKNPVNYHGRTRCPDCGYEFKVIDKRYPEIDADGSHKTYYCPKCRCFYMTDDIKHGSKTQEAILKELETRIPGIKDEVYWEYWDDKTWGPSHQRKVDIAIPKDKVVIEYDGDDHKGRYTKDDQNRKPVIDKGYTVIRIRSGQQRIQKNSKYGAKIFEYASGNQDEENEAIKEAIDEVVKIHRRRHDKRRRHNSCHCLIQNKNPVDIRKRIKDVDREKRNKYYAHDGVLILSGMTLGASATWAGLMLASLNKKSKKRI